jgi:lactate racemase
VSVERTVSLEYGASTIEVALPAESLVVEPGVTYQEPEPVDPEAATRQALRAPEGQAPLHELARGARRVVIAFPDRVKGGTHVHAHRRTALPLVLDALDRAGVPRDGLTLVCAMGLHRKNTREEMAAYLPAAILDRFGPDQLVNHDAEDPAGITDLGVSELGDPVQVNRHVAEADLTVVLGHVQGNPYGGFSGGYKTYTTGLTTWRSIAAHHVPATMHRSDFVPISTASHFRSQLRAIGEHIEANIAGPLFVLDAVVGRGATVLGVGAGSTRAVEEATWPLARRRTDIELDIPPADVVLFGLPRDFHYGPGMGTNPILVAQAVAATTARVAGALRPGCVVVAAAQCDGWFNDAWFPSYEETFERYAEVHTVADMGEVVEDVSCRPRYVDAYRHGYAYHPFHAFSMLSMAEIVHEHATAVLVAGAQLPGHARAMGLRPTRSVEEALRRAERIVGERPRILALPGFLTDVPPHLFASGGA